MTWTSTVWAFPNALDMEISYGPHSDDFFLVQTIPVVIPSSSVFGNVSYSMLTQSIYISYSILSPL